MAGSAAAPAQFDIEAGGRLPDGARARQDDEDEKRGAASEDKDAQVRAAVKEQVKKDQARAKENPANFHQAAAVYILGGKAGEIKSKFPRPENVARMTSDEMKLAWEAASDSISKGEKLVCHFTSMDSASMILGVDSPGFRASTVGQGGGGFFVCSVGPHELGWQQYQGGGFREKTGRELWGEKWENLLEGGSDEDKVEMVFFLKVPTPFYEQAAAIPGRELARIIPPTVLYEQDGYCWFQKEKIVKSYVLLRDAPKLEIAGEGPPPETSLPLKFLFALLSLAMVLFQTLAALAIIANTVHPSCATNVQCGRVGMYCDAEYGRCQWCSEAGHPDQTNAANATAFCSDTSHFSEAYCDDSTANEIRCAPPACRACPGPADDPNPGWGLPYRVAITRTGRGDQPLDINLRWQRRNETWRAESTWGITSQHTVLTGHVATMQLSDWAMLLLAATVVSFSLADEVRDIGLCEITIADRGGSHNWRPQSIGQWLLLAAAVLAGIGLVMGEVAAGPLHWALPLLTMHSVLVAPALVAYIDMQCDNSPWRVFMLYLNAIRRFAVVPLLATTVPVLVMFDSSNAKDIGLNTVGALFLLAVDNEAFAYALPDHIRTHVEQYGRAEIGDREGRQLNSVKAWTWAPLLGAMVGVVLAAKHVHDPAGGWMGDPILTAFLVCIFVMLPGVIVGALVEGAPQPADPYNGSVGSEAVVGVLATVWVVCSMALVMRVNSGVGGTASYTGFASGWLLALLALLASLRRLDSHDGGARASDLGALLGKFMVGALAGMAALAFVMM